MAAIALTIIILLNYLAFYYAYGAFEGSVGNKKKRFFSRQKSHRCAPEVVGRRWLTDEKSPPLFLRSIFIPTHHFLCFCLFFLSVPTDWVGKRCGRKLGGSIWSIHRQMSTLRYVNTITNNLLWWSHATYNATINIL